MSKLYYGDRYTFLQNNKCQNYIMVTATLSYKITKVKIYIMVTATLLTNKISNFTLQNLRRLQTTTNSTNSHIARNLSLPRPSKPRTKRNFGHPKVTTTRRNSWKINRLNNQSKIKSQYNPINYYITETTIRRTYYN